MATTEEKEETFAWLRAMTARFIKTNYPYISDMHGTDFEKLCANWVTSDPANLVLLREELFTRGADVTVLFTELVTADFFLSAFCLHRVFPHERDCDETILTFLPFFVKNVVRLEYISQSLSFQTFILLHAIRNERLKLANTLLHGCAKRNIAPMAADEDCFLWVGEIWSSHLQEAIRSTKSKKYISRAGFWRVTIFEFIHKLDFIVNQLRHVLPNGILYGRDIVFPYPRPGDLTTEENEAATNIIIQLRDTFRSEIERQGIMEGEKFSVRDFYPRFFCDAKLNT